MKHLKREPGSKPGEKYRILYGLKQCNFVEKHLVIDWSEEMKIVHKNNVPNKWVGRNIDF